MNFTLSMTPSSATSSNLSTEVSSMREAESTSRKKGVIFASESKRKRFPHEAILGYNLLEEKSEKNVLSCVHCSRTFKQVKMKLRILTYNFLLFK